MHMMTSTEYLEAPSKTFLATMGVLLLGVVAGVDYITSTRYVLEFSPFYVVPVAFFTWFIGRRAAVGMGFVCAGIGLAARLHSIPRLSAYWDALVWFGLYLAAIVVLSELKKLYERERSLSRLDSLTHIANRRALLEAATAAMSSAKRHHTAISLAYIDLDNFKQMNDLLGHESGDKVLRATAMSIRDALRPTDLVARIGGMSSRFFCPRPQKLLPKGLSPGFERSWNMPCTSDPGRSRSASAS